MSKLVMCKTCGKEVSKSAKICPSCGEKLKAGKMKKLGIGLVVVVILIIIASLGSGGGSTAYELSKMTSMSKQEIVDKFGKPNEVVRDDKDGYIYSYNKGFSVSGTDKGAIEIQMLSDMVKDKTSDTYKIFDVTLGSSFDENVKRLGKPNSDINKDGQKGAMYLTKENFFLIFTSEQNSDKVATIKFVQYATSEEAKAFNIAETLGTTASEDELKKVQQIKNKSNQGESTLYELNGLNIVVDNKNNTITKAFITGDSIYNIHGIRVNDSLDASEKIFGKSISSLEGVKNTTQYFYEYNNVTNINKILLSVDNSSKKIVYMEVSLK